MNKPNYKERWQGYALLDSGDFAKLENFGGLLVARPEPLAIWNQVEAAKFKHADIGFQRGPGQDGKEGDWAVREEPPRNWQANYGALKFNLRLTAFKHVGIFPEQASNWDWIQKQIKPGQKVLNLFAYTGGATLAAAQTGAQVVHVDSSKPAVAWAKENAELSGLKNAPIRYLEDDVLKLAAREARRGHKYDAIFLDPPAFGRGPKGELWKFERDLPKLMNLLKAIINQKQGHLLLNTYSLGFPGLAMEQLVRSTWPFVKEIKVEDLGLHEENQRGFVLPAGFATRASW
ncbi:class I SAM-dependent methyltransferase [Patescibacteria group bacterium]|nr:class I SAM-dependent methyltransferase [Patescibacteria group bacterium]MBU1705429.1 class I SAM-dependent methyltransferase [Patescibacteria group bacterium]